MMTHYSPVYAEHPNCQSGTIFGVEKGTPPYYLRQARYYDLGQEIARFAWLHFQSHHRKLELLDVGTGDGVLRRYTEIHPGAEYICWNAVDIYPQGTELVYKSTDWIHYRIDLNDGMLKLPPESFDMVVCEQCLEHLSCYQLAMSELVRVLRSGGRIALGVPIFPDGLHLIRKYVVPVTDKIFGVKKRRGHIQAWSKRSFCADIRTYCPGVQIEKVRGFRIVSGGLLRPLDYCRCWWRYNRFIGKILPSLCIEIQIIGIKLSSVAR